MSHTLAIMYDPPATQHGGNVCRMRKFWQMVEKFSFFIIGTHDFNGPDNIIKGLVQL